MTKKNHDNIDDDEEFAIASIRYTEDGSDGEDRDVIVNNDNSDDIDSKM